MAAGHLASIGLVAVTVLFGLAMDRWRVQVLAGGLLLLAVVLCLAGRWYGWRRAPSGHIGMALGSFMMSTAHGAGLGLVPALTPLCFGGDAPAREVTTGSLGLAIAAVGVHTAAMLLVSGALAMGASRGFDAASGWHASHKPQPSSGRL